MVPLNGYNFNFYNILIFSGVVYGVVFCVAVWRIKLIPKVQRSLLILTVLTITLSNLQYWLIDIGIRERMGIHKVFHLQFELLIVQFFYLFVKVYLGQRLNRLLLYFLGFIFILGLVYQYYSFVVLQNLELRKNYNFIAEIFTIIYSLFFFVLSFKELIAFRNQEQGPSLNTRWLLSTLLLGSLVIILWIVGTQIFHITGNTLFSTYYPLWISMSLLVYYIGYRSFNEMFIFYQRVEIRRKLIDDLGQSNLDNRKRTKNTLFGQIEDYIKLEKEYLNPNLSLQLLSDKFKVSTSYISQLFNKKSDGSFTDYVNGLRINEAKRMLSSVEYDNYTIDSIGLESGFKTKSNFYNAFKKHMEVTPSHYRNRNFVQNN